MTQQRTEEWNRDALSRLIHDKTWNGEFWGRDGAIQLALKQFNQLVNWRTDSQARAAAHSSLSSTYYSAAGNAYARFQAAHFLVKVPWAFRGLRCFRKANWLSDEAKRYRGGLRGMTANELVVRSSIKRKKRDWLEALACIDDALSRLDPNYQFESQALLLAGKGEILDHWGRHKEASVVFRRALEISDLSRRQTNVRVLKALGSHLRRVGDFNGARWRYSQALGLAQERGGMEDQVIKIRALLARLPK